MCNITFCHINFCLLSQNLQKLMSRKRFKIEQSHDPVKIFLIRLWNELFYTFSKNNDGAKALLGDWAMLSLVECMRVGDHNGWMKCKTGNFRRICRITYFGHTQKLIFQKFSWSDNCNNQCRKELSDFFLHSQKLRSQILVYHCLMFLGYSKVTSVGRVNWNTWISTFNAQTKIEENLPEKNGLPPLFGLFWLQIKYS